MIFLLIISSLLITIIFLSLEKYFYNKRINSLDIRILVNGTRGKSSVTEFITAALNASGKNTIGKITGIIPTLFFHNGAKKIIKRFNGARVQEQIKVVKFASLNKANALVLECMSIQPELQKFESTWFKPHVYVLTNILNDHQEELGLNEEEQAKAICSAIPYNSIVVTNEKRFLEMVKSFALQRNSTVYTCSNISLQTPFNSETFVTDNIIIALKVCEVLNIDQNVSEKAILKVIENFPPIHTEYISGNKKIKFLNAFGANDVTSTEKILEVFKDKCGPIKNPIFVFNSRSDRPYRTIKFAQWLCTINNIFHIYLIGNHSLKAKKEVINRGISESKIKVLTRNELDELFTDINEYEKGDLSIIGIGNVADEGFQIINHFIPKSNLEGLRL